MSRFLCIVIPDFPAWAVACSEPELRGVPLLVHARGRVVAASATAQQAGVRRGWALERARALLPEAPARPHLRSLTEAAWESALEALYELSPWIEPVRAGLVLAELQPEKAVTPLLRQWEARGGSADDRTTAELAALSTEPGKLRRVPPGKSRAFLSHVPCALFSEVGQPEPGKARPLEVDKETVERLGWFGWNTVAQLRDVTRRQLVAQFEAGELLHRYAAATDVRPIAPYTLPSRVTEHWCFEEPVSEPCEVEPVLALLLQRACDGLDGQSVHTVTVQADFATGRRQARRLLHEPARSTKALHHAALWALHTALPATPSPMLRLELQLGGLTRPAPIQGCLFMPRRPPPQLAERAVEQRFPGTLRRIAAINPQAYLPEERFRLEAV